jgi:hypothetical protein
MPCFGSGTAHDRQILCDLAGGSAQRRYNPLSWNDGCDADINKPMFRVRNHDLQPFQRRADEMVEQHWTAIQRVAEALLERNTIWGRTLLRLIDPEGGPVVPLELRLS